MQKQQKQQQLIPKTIIQTARFAQPQYVMEIIKKRSKGWEYLFFKDEDIEKFFEMNPMEEFKNVKERFRLLSGPHKSDLFRYYYLYLKGGVYIDSDAIMEEDMNVIVKDKYTFFSVKSLDPAKNHMFQGVLGSIKGHSIIYESLKHLYNIDVERLNTTETNIYPYFECTIFMYEEYERYMKTHSDESDSIKIFNECISEKNDGCVFTHDADDESKKRLFSHYHRDKIILKEPNQEFINNKKPMKEMKIGVTTAVPSSMFVNGIHQNSLYFHDLLARIGYDAYLIVVDADCARLRDSPPEGWNTDVNDRVVKYSDIYSFGFNAIFCLGFECTLDCLSVLKYMNVRLVGYFCGNSCLIAGENILYHTKEYTPIQHVRNKPKEHVSIYDEIWVIPQMMNMNEHYFRILYRCKIIEVPFIWSPVGLETAFKKEKLEDFMYKCRRPEKKKIATLDPNISIMKWCLPAVLICEQVYREVPNRIDHVYVTNFFREKIGDKLNNASFMGILKSTNLLIDKKVSVEMRYQSIRFMKDFADIAVFHQWENPLNYVYLELAWMGYPIIHNAHLCKELGYYYEGFNYDMGSAVLKEAIFHHDNNIKEYIRKSRNYIDRYVPTNVELQQKYIKLIDDLFF